MRRAEGPQRVKDFRSRYLTGAAVIRHDGQCVATGLLFLGRATDLLFPV